MNNRLFRYSDFLNESKIEMLLEANIKYANLFNKVLGLIDSPVAKALLDLSGTDVDVNTNFIDVNRDKDDVVFFKPDDKVAKSAMVPQPYAYYDELGKRIIGDEFRTPDSNQAGEVIRELTREELEKDYGVTNFESRFGISYANNKKLVVFQWRDSKGVGKCLYDSGSLVFGEEAVKKSEVGVGRFVRAILKKADIQFKEVEIEDFVYKYRAEVAKLGDVFSRFKILKGEDIRKYYHQEKYENGKGTLGSSCMKYDRCQGYLDIYVKNPEQCSLVVLMSDDKEDGICGRAILWTDEDGKRIMDRIYTNRTQDEQLFKDFAKREGFYHKRNQNMSEDEPFISPKTGEEETIKTKIKLSINKYDYFPYMDSFKYFYEGSSSRPSYLTNSTRFNYDFELTDTDGGHSNSECECCGGDASVECYECNGRGSFRCQNCDGDGTLECGACGGAHEMDCPDCDGSGEDEEGNKCSGCDGSGTHTCEECGGEDIECGDCGGEGRNECEDCGGDGSRECPECQ
jgi:hypothetical protein